MAKRDRFGRDKMSPELAALTREWYGKLKATGFVDIEPPPDRLGVNSYLDGHYIEARKRVIRGVSTGKSEVFRLAERWLHDTPWRTRADRMAFALWARGWDLSEVFGRQEGLGKRGGFLWRHARYVEIMTEHYQRQLAQEVDTEDPDEIDEDEFAPSRVYTSYLSFTDTTHGN